MIDFIGGLFVGIFISSIFAIIVLPAPIIKQEDLLRFCMTHSIPLEQCKIPDEGE